MPRFLSSPDITAAGGALLTDLSGAINDQVGPLIDNAVNVAIPAAVAPVSNRVASIEGQRDIGFPAITGWRGEVSFAEILGLGTSQTPDANFDAQPAIQAHIDSGYQAVTFGSAYTIGFNNPLTLYPGRTKLEGRNTRFFYRKTSDYAFKVYPNFLGPFAGAGSVFSNNDLVSGIRLQGPDVGGNAAAEAANTADGVFIGRPSDPAYTGGNTSWASFRNFHVDGFRDNIVVGDQTWLNIFINHKNGNFYRTGIRFLTRNNAGEQMNFHGGVLYDGHSSANDALGIFVDIDSKVDANFVTMSFDYIDLTGEQNSGRLTFLGCFDEAGGSNPKWRINSTSGKDPSFHAWIGGAHKPPVTSPTGVGGAADEPTGGRLSYYDLSGDNTTLVLRDTSANRFGKPKTQIIRVLSGNPSIDHQNLDVVSVVRGDQCMISSRTSQVNNNAFAADLAGWQTGGAATIGSGVTFARQPGTGPVGLSNSARITKSDGANDFYAFYRVPCKNGKRQLAQVMAKMTGLTAGQVWLAVTQELYGTVVSGSRTLLHGFSVNGAGATINLAATNGSTTTATAGADANSFVQLSNRFVPSRGSVTYRLEIYATADAVFSSVDWSGVYAWEQ